MLKQRSNQERICEGEARTIVPNATFRPLLCSLALLALTSACLKADAFAYAMINSAQAQTFGTLDLNSGVFAAINSNEDALQVAGNVTALTLASLGGNLYALGAGGGNTLYQVNPTTGNLTVIASVSPTSFIGLGSTTSGLFEGGNPNTLYSLNPSTAATTAISGNSFVPGFSVPYAFSENGSVLLVSDNTTLFGVNLATGALTTIGNFGTGIAMDAMLFEGGVLYGAAGGVSIDTINTTTAVPTVLELGLSGPDTANAAIGGLAPDVQITSSTPEPSSVMLIGLGIAFIGCVRHRRSTR
jgi:hypothetical protein